MIHFEARVNIGDFTRWARNFKSALRIGQDGSHLVVREGTYSDCTIGVVVSGQSGRLRKCIFWPVIVQNTVFLYLDWVEHWLSMRSVTTGIILEWTDSNLRQKITWITHYRPMYSDIPSSSSQSLTRVLANGTVPHIRVPLAATLCSKPIDRTFATVSAKMSEVSQECIIIPLFEANLDL